MRTLLHGRRWFFPFIGRLDATGALDPTFNPGANHNVSDFALQPDSTILIGAYFTGLGGGTGTTPRSKIGRLHADGTVDADLNPGVNGAVKAMAMQPDGRFSWAASSRRSAAAARRRATTSAGSHPDPFRGKQILYWLSSTVLRTRGGPDERVMSRHTRIGHTGARKPGRRE